MRIDVSMCSASRAQFDQDRKLVFRCRGVARFLEEGAATLERDPAKESGLAGAGISRDHEPFVPERLTQVDLTAYVTSDPANRARLRFCRGQRYLESLDREAV